MWKGSTRVSLGVSSFRDCQRKSQTCVGGKFAGGSDPPPYIPIHALPPPTSVFLQARTWRETPAAACQTSLVGVSFFFLFINPKDAQINISHKHCTFIGQNQPSELHVSTFQVKEKNNTDFFSFFGCLAISQNYSKCLIYFLNIKKTAIIPSSLVRPSPRREEAACFVFFFLGAVLWIVRAVILSLFCRAYVG